MVDALGDRLIDTPSPSPSAIGDGPPEHDHGAERRSRILDAAERCFVRSGFHRTTMQDVAAEVGMSPGNLYRYFRSKHDLVAGLAERDRARVTSDFSALVGAPDFISSFAALGRKHFEDEPREKAVLCLEIWAEATRNPAIAAMTEEFDRDVTERMSTLFRKAQREGAFDAGVDPQALALLVLTLANGLFVRRAVSPSFDPERDFGAVMAVIEAAFAGRIPLQAVTKERSSRTAPEESAA
jgi:AcrR family transcriptional regulator